MSMIFGEESPSAMFAPRNGFIMSSGIEKKFDQHLIALVPRSALQSWFAQSLAVFSIAQLYLLLAISRSNGQKPFHLS